MHEPLSHPYPPNVQVELAKERNHIAADRTLLSFIRNSVLLISIGVGIDQVLKNLFPGAASLDVWFYVLDVGLIGLGVLNLLFAVWDYQGEIKRLNRPEYTFTPRWSLSEATGIMLCILGCLVFLKLALAVLGDL